MSKESPYVIEACVETHEEALRAVSNGADQIELCKDLHCEGLTPTDLSIRKCLNELNIPLKVMLRIRSGSFVYDDDDKALLVTKLKQLKKYPLHTIVFGALTKSTQLDLEFIQQIRDLAFPIGICIHKAIDLCPDILASVDALLGIGGIQEILSSGGSPTAAQGISTLIQMKGICADEITLIGAGTITQNNLAILHKSLGLKAYHGRKIVGDLSL